MKKDNKTIVTEIVIKAPRRTTSDVGQWRTALQSADMGRMKLLYDLYEDLLIDGVLADAEDKRIKAVTNSAITFQDQNGEEVADILALIDSPAFEDLLTTIMQVRFWGRAGGEFDFTDTFKFNPIPPKHINLNKHIILIQENDDHGVDYLTDDNLLVLGKKRDYGLFLKTAPLAIWKRGGFGDYAQWLELFGMPQRVGKYSSYDKESRQLLEQALEKSGSAPWVVIPKETDVETVNNTGTGSSSNAHNDFRKACNEEMLITLLGQTLTTVAGDKGARSLGQVHKAVEEGKNRADMRFVKRILNTYVVPLLEKRGFPIKGGSFMFPEAVEPISVSDIISLTAIIDIPSDFLHKKYSIPVAKDGDVIAKKSTQPAVPPPVPEPTPPDPNAKPVKKPKIGKKNIKNADLNFMERLYDFFVKAPSLRGAGANTGNLLTLLDDTLNDRLIKQTADGDTGFNIELFDWISHDLLKALDQKPASLTDWGFAYDYQNDAFRTAQEMNLFHFSAAKSIAELEMLQELYRKSKSFNEFYKMASAKLDVFNKDWQRTEWETASLIAAGTQNYQRLAKKTKLFPYWEYKTAGDDRVRPSHRMLEGIILPANDPRWDKIWPPNGWKCRGYVVPRLASEVVGVDFDAMRARVDEFLATPEWKQDEAQGFGINRALKPELFTANQMYLKKFPGMAVKKLQDVNYQTYKLGSYEQVRAKATRDIQKYNNTLEAFMKGLPKDNGLNYFTDYNGRKVIVDTGGWLAGHKGKEAARAIYMLSLQETIALPDEVWLNGDNLNQFVFFKYYKNEVMAAIVEVKNGEMKLTTWFPVSETSGSTVKARQKKHKYKYRWGMLIKKPGQ